MASTVSWLLPMIFSLLISVTAYLMVSLLLCSMFKLLKRNDLNMIDSPSSNRKCPRLAVYAAGHLKNY